MNVALLGDVHGNLPAIEAVLADARRVGAEAVWNLGDFLGYGPFPDEVVGCLRAAGAVSIIGNYDEKVLRFHRKQAKWRITKAAEKYTAFRFAAERLSDAARGYLTSLPRQAKLELGPLRVLLTHGSPAAHDEALGPETPDERFRQLASMAEADVVACGHSHRPFDRRVDGVWFVNPGSVGRPEGEGPQAQWALLGVERGQLTVEHRRVDYDVQRTVEAIRSRGLPEDFARMLLWGENLDQVRRRQAAAAAGSRR
jgi:putative phosphoesterase